MYFQILIKVKKYDAINKILLYHKMTENNQYVKNDQINY